LIAMQRRNGRLRDHINTSMQKPVNHHKNPGMQKAHGNRSGMPKRLSANRRGDDKR
jgi:hypothetical protein